MSVTVFRRRPTIFTSNQHKRHISSYRYWLYGFNFVLIVVLFTFVSITCKILHKDRMRLFPLEHSEPLVLYLFCGPLLQLVDILTGLLGVWRRRSILLTVYWWLLLAILVCDLITGILWIFRWRSLHALSGKYFLQSMATMNDDEPFCRRWNSVQTELGCCGVYSAGDWSRLSRFCGEDLLNGTRLPRSCCGRSRAAAAAIGSQWQELCGGGGGANGSRHDETTMEDIRDFPNDDDEMMIHFAESNTKLSTSVPPGCRDSLIKWLYHQSNIVFLLGICVVVFLKVVGLVIMRTEIRKLGDEIFARENRSALIAQPKFSVDLSPFAMVVANSGGGENGRSDSTEANGSVSIYTSMPASPSNKETVRLVVTDCQGIDREHGDSDSHA